MLDIRVVIVAVAVVVVVATGMKETKLICG